MLHMLQHSCSSYLCILLVSLDSACRVTWHFPAAGFMGILAMSGLTSLIWQRSSQSNLCDHIAPGTDQLENSLTQPILNHGV